MEPGKSRGRDVAPAFLGQLWGHKGTFLVWDSHGHIVGWRRGGCRALHQRTPGSGSQQYRGSPTGGTPLHAPLCCTPPSRSPPLRRQPSPLPGCDFILLSSLPPSLLPRSPLPSPQVPAVTLSWFLEPVVGFLKEPWGLPPPPSCSPKPCHSHSLGPPGMRGTGGESRGVPEGKKFGRGWKWPILWPRSHGSAVLTNSHCVLSWTKQLLEGGF